MKRDGTVRMECVRCLAIRQSPVNMLEAAGARPDRVAPPRLRLVRVAPEVGGIAEPAIVPPECEATARS